MAGADPPFNPNTVLAAARDDDAAAIEAAVRQHGPDAILYANRIGQTALHVAAIQGSVRAIGKLIDLGADPNVENAMAQTPLHFAAAANRNAYATCCALLDAGADPFVVDQHGRLPYEIARDDDIRALLGGPDPKLYEAAAAGDVAALRALFEADPEADPSPMGAEGRAPIHLAAAGGHLGAVNFLLERGAPLDQHELKSGDTAVHLAVRAGNAALVTLLHRRGAALGERNFCQSEYGRGGWTSEGKELGPLHQTALHVAAEEGDAGMAAALLALGAAADAADFDGRTPLHYALEVGDGEMLEVLLKGGADANKGCRDFPAPLHAAVRQGDAEAAAGLLAAGAAPDVADEQGWTPLMLAARSGRAAVVAALLGAGADVRRANAAGATPLHLAAANGRVEVCKALLAAGAARDAANAEGKTPADLAKGDEVRALLAGP